MSTRLIRSAAALSLLLAAPALAHAQQVGHIGKTKWDSTARDLFKELIELPAHLRARELARMEGMMVGYSSGAALQALEQIQDELTEDDIVVLLFSDHGSKYATKFFSDKWMIEQGFMEAPEVKAL